MSLTLYIGPMFSGKSTELIKYVNTYEIYGFSYILIIPNNKRGFLARDIKCELDKVHITDIIDSALWKKIKNIKYILIDELQLFTKIDKAFFVKCLKGGKMLHVAALNASSQLLTFPNVSAVLPYATEIKFIPGICKHCGNVAIFHIKKNGDQLKTIDIGDDDKYETCCINCMQ